MWEKDINQHLDEKHIISTPTPKLRAGPSTQTHLKTQPSIASLFGSSQKSSRPSTSAVSSTQASTSKTTHSRKRSTLHDTPLNEPGPSKRTKTSAASRLHAAAPLADRLRPTTLEEFVGQPHLTGPGSLLMNMLDTGMTGSLIFWGPPGCGKTTLARLLAKRTDAIFKELSATDAGISDVRAVVEEAKGVLTLTGRWAPCDIFLPFLEQGHLQLIGATTENPSFKLTSALLSRCRVFVLERLTDEDVARIVTQAVERVSPDVPHQPVEPEPSSPEIPSSQPETEEQLSQPHLSSQSSSTTAVPQRRTHGTSLLELVLSSPPHADPDAVLASLRRSVSTSYDRTGDSHYDMISALHKSRRALLAARMLSAGEDPLYIARRMVVCASEDIGLADNHALPLAMAALQACQVIGMPECRINLAHLVSYLSEAPKSTRAYQGYNRAEEAAKLDATIPVPLVVRNAPTGLMKDLGYGHSYCYNPDYLHPVTNDYLPIQFRGDVFLRPAGDVTDKIWDEAALRRWEMEENGGRPWDGREEQNMTQQPPNQSQMTAELNSTLHV
ncbi:P-loop containing nucleoside triphosphate hydrolase protein [Amylocystis lapponica]|nr:P-loop containing nucleoside triphosphate hydrolase protein [Amylocystis lapponica]